MFRGEEKATLLPQPVSNDAHLSPGSSASESSHPCGFLLRRERRRRSVGRGFLCEGGVEREQGLLARGIVGHLCMIEELLRTKENIPEMESRGETTCQSEDHRARRVRG